MRQGAIAILTFSAEGIRVAQHLRSSLSDCQLFLHNDAPEHPLPHLRFSNCASCLKEEFLNFSCWIFIAPTGIAVRSISPLVNSKYQDPAVLVVDVGGRHVISLLSGHEGGANEYAVMISNILAAEPVITTTTEAAKTWIAGIGCRKGASHSAIQELLEEALQLQGISRGDIRFLASADIKKEEPGLLALAKDWEIPLRFFPPFLIQSMEYQVETQPFVKERLGLPGVAEPAALLGGRRTQLCLNRIARNGVTIALAQENCWWWESDPVALKTEPSEP